MLGNVSCHLQVNVCRFGCLNLSRRVTDLEKFIQDFISNSCQSLGCSIYPLCDSFTIQNVVRQLLNFIQTYCCGTVLPRHLDNSPLHLRGHFCVARHAPQIYVVYFGLLCAERQPQNKQLHVLCQILVLFCICAGDSRLGNGKILWPHSYHGII